MRVPNSISGIGQDVLRENRRHRGGTTHGPPGPPAEPPGGILASANRTASAPAYRAAAATGPSSGSAIGWAIR